MDVAIAVSAPSFTAQGVCVICDVATSAGTTFQVVVPVNLSLSASQINSTITEAVKTEGAKYGASFPSNARIRIFGAAS